MDPTPRASPTWSTSRLSGRASSTLGWEVAIPQFSGTQHVTELNRRVRASAHEAIDAAMKDFGASPEHPTTLQGRSSVTTNDGRTAQVVLSLVGYQQGAAHGTDVVYTTAVDMSSGRPITLTQVFRDEHRALLTLAPAIRKAAAAVGEQIVEQDGLAPRETNWANWQTDRSGMVFYFQDYQLGGHGTRSYAVPWRTVSPLMSARSRSLLGPAGDSPP